MRRIFRSLLSRYSTVRIASVALAAAVGAWVDLHR